MSPQLPVPDAESLTRPQPFLTGSASQPLKTRLFHQFTQGIALIACALLSYYLISHYLVQTVRVIGMSMVPTLHDSQLYLLNRWVLHVRAPARSEIVVLFIPDGGFAAGFFHHRGCGRFGLFPLARYIHLNGAKTA